MKKWAFHKLTCKAITFHLFCHICPFHKLTENIQITIFIVTVVSHYSFTTEKTNGMDFCFGFHSFTQRSIAISFLPNHNQCCVARQEQQYTAHKLLVNSIKQS